MPVIAPPDWLDKKFLETALKTEVDSFEVSALGAVGDGYTSNLFRVEVELKEDKRQSVIVKRLAQSGDDNKFMWESTMFDRETLMYRETLPKLEAILERAFPGETHPIGPQHIYSSSGVLVMDDLAASGFEMKNRIEGLDLEHSLLVVRALAKFHAASIILHQEDPEALKMYDRSLFSEVVMQDNMRAYFTGMTCLLADEVETWPEFGEKYAKKLRAMAPKMVELCEFGARREEGRFNVLTHDDLWVNNLLFRGLKEVRFIDFQLPHFASAGNDLQVFFGTSLTDEVRQNHLDTLFKEYHTALRDILASLGYTGKYISMEQLKDEYRRSSLYGLTLAAVFLPAVVCRLDCVIPIFDAHCNTLDSSIYSESKYMELIKEILPKFEEQGAFSFAEKFFS
ncbi:uncharacterized protein [Periplaneta americana]|uniref:uncharacterized protein isoform X2 n=1 Tax=Periplaneta americana TaxID=6978 RepID=UPI0037E9172A